MDNETALPILVRNSAIALKVASAAYPYKCCVVCGLAQEILEIAHLDHNAGNNDPCNLAFLCPTHHGMYDRGLYPREAIEMLRDHWQKTKGKVEHGAYMKDAGIKARDTRRRNVLARERSETASKAAATRLLRKNAARLSQPAE